MRKIFLGCATLCVISILLLVTNSYAKSTVYNRTQAKEYAGRYNGSGIPPDEGYNTEQYKCWNPGNPKCESAVYGSDCANFMSQALIKGGLNFDCLFGKGKGDNAKADKREFVEGSVVIGKDAKTTGIRSANDLYTALEDSFCFKKVSASEAIEGDIAAWRVKGRNWVHHVVMLNEEGYYTGHTSNVSFDAKKKAGDYKDKNGIQHVVSFYHFQDDEKCKKCEQDEKTCKAELKEKCTGCFYCVESTGECKDRCVDKGAGRCASRWKCIEVTYEGEPLCYNMGPSGDCPDDTLTVGSSTPIDSEITHLSGTSFVGILKAGYSYDILKVLSTFGQQARIISSNDFDPSLVSEMPLFIIATGGLMGLAESEILKTALNEYVKKGGTLIVFSQQHGYEFSALPVPEEADGTYKKVGGFGWLEDQSCQINSSYIDTWHQMLAGQTKSTPSINIDGYFISYPENTQIILRRTSNGQPALITYPFGDGRVIATTAYIDYAFTSNQTSAEDVALLRDIVAWAKYPMPLTEGKPGQSITVDLPIKNTDDTFSAVGVDIVFYDPDRNFVKREGKQALTLAPGENTSLPINIPIQQDSKVGIHQIKYELYTEDWILWPSEENPDGDLVWTDIYFQGSIKDPSGRFVVSNPPKTQAQIKQMTFSIQSDAEIYVLGDAVNLTVLAFNSSDVERTITAKFGGQSRVMVVPAQGSSSFVYSKTAQCDHDHYGQWWGIERVSFYEEAKTIGALMKLYRVYLLSAKVTVQTDKTTYTKGETVTVNTTLKNNISLGWQPNVKITVTDFKGTAVFEDLKTLTLQPSGTASISNSFILTPALPIGNYLVNVQVPSSFSAWAWARFELPQSQISVSPSLPSIYNVGTNTLPFTITNMGKVNVNSGSIDLSLKAPDGSIVYSGSQPFSIAVGETKTLDIPISIPSPRLGYYTLTYSQSDETRTGYPTSIILPNSYNLDLSLDKPSYKIGEATNVTVSLTNTGKFVQEGSLALDVPFLGLSETRSVTINPSVTENIPFSFPLPLTLKQGGSVQLTFTFPSGDRIERGIYLAIKPAGINQNIVFDKASYRIRENLGINYTITNNGNFATPLNVSFNLSIPDLNYIYEGSLVLEPMNDVAVPFVIPLPETLLPGWHNVNVTLALPWEPSFTRETGFVVPESSLLLSYLGTTTPMAGDTISLSIENTGGVDTTYTTQTLSINDNHGVEIYNGSVTGAILTGEKKTLIDIQIPAQVLNGPAYLHVQMRDSKTAKTVYYDRAIGITGLAASLQTMTDKNTYLLTEAITGISSILNGPYGIEQGSMKVSVNRISQATTGQFTQFLPKEKGVNFSYPGGVAVGSDGSVYVTDSENHRIQKFDSNGNIIRKWGSYCNIDSDGDGIVDQSCNGQFNYPYSIAVGSDGSVYVADSENHRIQKFDSNGTFITKWGSYCQADTNWDGIPDQSCNDGQFNYPGGVAVGADGSVYVADSENHRIQKFDSDGTFITKWGSYCQADTNWDGIPDQSCNDGQFNYPGGVAVGADGSVYVADGNHRIQKFDSNGTFITKWGSYCITDTNGDGISDQPCEGQFYYPSGIAIGIDGSIYVVEFGNARIQKFDSNGTFFTKWGSYCQADTNWDGIPDQPCEGGQFADPYGIAISPDGSLYVADSQNNRIQKFDSSGNFLMKWGSGGAGNDNGEFNTPFGVTVGNDGSIYITDSGNSRIQKFDSNGDFITKWGSVGNEDGQFDWPAGIASGADGSVYVADTNNNRIQKFDSNGNFISKWLVFGIEQSFDGPLGIAVGPDGSVYVADTNNYRIEKFDSNGNLITQWEISWGMCGEVNCPPTGIAVGPDGAVYGVDPYNHRIHKFDSNGSFITSWELSGAPCDEFCPPAGIAVGPDGSVYAADTNSSLIQKFDGNGNLIAAWGSSGSDDGQFYNPGGIAVDPNGSIYVADMGNHRIQKMITVTTEYIAETLFETTIPINQPASATQDYTTDIGTLSVTGKLLLQAILKNNLSQTMGQAGYPFYIVDGNTVLLFNTDKKIYKLGETVTITGQVENRATIEAVGLTLALNSKLNAQTPGLLFTETFNIPAGGTQPFTITATAGAEGIVTLTGNVTQNNLTLVEITDQYEVAKSNVSAAVSMPDVIGSAPFDINVEIRNTGKVEATVQFGIQSSEFGDSQTITIPPGEIKDIQYSQQISIDTTYTFTFTGDLEQTLQQMVRFGESAEVQLTLQPSYREGDILLTYQLRNTGMLEAAYPVTFTLFSSGQEISKTVRTFTLPANGSVSDSLNYNLGEGSYILRYETRGFQAESQINVAKAIQGEITMAVNDFYSEGSIILPYTVQNIGAFDAEFAFEFELGTSLISKTAFIPAGGDYSGDLRFNLPFGNYTIKATLVSQPANPFSRSFQVLKENIAEMAVTLGTQTNGLIPVNVNLTNLGFNEISGSVNVSVSPSAGSGETVWNGEEPLSQLLPQSSQLINFIINPSAILPGNYLLKAELLNNSNQLIAARSLEFGVQSANFQITQLPPYQTFMAGQEATFVFRVRNIGDQESSFDLRFKAYDLIDSTKREWLKPGEEKAIPFGFILPEDLEEKDYFATYELKAQSSKVTGVSGGQIKYHLAGINLNVNATLDKPYYTEGETAHLTINIQSTNPNPQNLFARMNYAGYEPQQTFTLSGNQVLIFDIPLPKITGEKLFYGIYHEEGRSIHLNSLYIHKAGDVITITTDKQVYNAGETVSVSVTGSATGDMTLSAPGGYTETFTFTGSATKSFPLPATIAAGTYFISYQLSTTSGESYTGTYPFDVAGIQVKVLECNNDKGKYASSDNIATNFTISSNTTMPAILKAWIVDPTGQYTSVGEQSITLSSSEGSLITYNSALSTSVSGIHRLVYGIYGPEDLLLCSGSEAFDVGDAVLMGLSTDKKDYPTNTEPVIITASLFGSVDANLGLELDGTVIKSETILLNGFTPYTTELQNIKPGPHILKATLTAGGLKSTKETSFTYALAYMPKPQISAFPAYVDFGIINLGSTSTQTITLSSTGNVDLVIGTIALSGANQGEFSLQNDNCSGGTFAPSGTCTLGVLFSPTSIGAKSASLFIPSNAIDTPTLILSLEGASATTLNLSINPEGGGRVTGTGIDCPGDCTESFSTSEAAIQLTATPAEGYIFTNWTGDINLTENPVTMNMDTNKNVTANFSINAYTINVTVSLGGNITPSGSVTVNPGGSQTFVVTPNPGYYIVDLRVDDVSVGAVTTYTMSNITSNHTIEAIFAIAQYTITSSSGSNGTVSPLGTLIVNYGGSQTFTITPDAGYHVADVKVDGVSVGAVTTFTLDNVTSHHTIEASFDMDTTATWAKTYGGQGYDVALSARQTGDGGYIVAGESWSFSPLFSDAWVIKLDANGSIQWQKRYGRSLNDVIYSIEQTQDGGYIMAGETNAVLPFLGLFWVIKINANGEVQWQKTYSQGWAHSIQQTSEGGYVATGMNMGKSWIVKLDANGSIQWQKKYAGILGDLAQSVQQTSEGGYIVTGMMKGEVWGLKLNSAGETQWQKTYGNSCVDANFSIQQTQEGGYIMASVSLTFGAGYTDIWIVKLDPNGEIEWQKTYGGSGFDLAHAIQQTQDGGYVVGGWTGSFGSGDKDAWVLKLDANGEIEWQKTYGGSGFDLAHSVQQTQDGGYVAVGWTGSFGAGDTDMWVLKLDANGNMTGCPEELIGTTSIVPYNTSATMSQCNETGQTTYVSPKSGSATVKGTTFTPGSVCSD